MTHGHGSQEPADSDDIGGGVPRAVPPALTRPAPSPHSSYSPPGTTGPLPAVPGLGPSGLSDYAVSPLGMNTALLGNEVRVAVLARTSTEDQQDPRLSIMRQVGNCRSSLPQ